MDAVVGGLRGTETALPDWPFAPDFWTFGRYEFASRRLRDALAQPGGVVQFLPFDLVRASAAARTQDYRWMRVLARQDSGGEVVWRRS